jgi:hypothetical protein
VGVHAYHCRPDPDARQDDHRCGGQARARRAGAPTRP